MPKRATFYLSNETLTELTQWPNKSERVNQVFERYKILLRSHLSIEDTFSDSERVFLAEYLRGKPVSQMLVAFMATDIGGRSAPGIDVYDLSERLRRLGPGGRLALIERLEATK